MSFTGEGIMSVFVKIVHFVTTFFKLCMVLGMDIG